MKQLQKDFITNNALEVINLDIQFYGFFYSLYRTKENLNLDKSTLTILRYIAIIGQLLAINIVFFYLKLEFY